MPLGEMIQLWNGAGGVKSMMMLLVIHCAPLLKKLTFANILALDHKGCREICQLLSDTEISCCCLSRRSKRAVVFLYRKEELAAYLHRKDVADFLKEFGYENLSVEDMIERLSCRIRQFDDGDVEYPHEIGVFLGYPLEDVRGFIRNKGKNYVENGYWKVYQNETKKQQLFRLFDEVRSKAVREVMQGREICEIAIKKNGG